MEKDTRLKQYEPPEVEALTVEVERGYAGSGGFPSDSSGGGSEDVGSQLPTWGIEDGTWQ